MRSVHPPDAVATVKGRWGLQHRPLPAVRPGHWYREHLADCPRQVLGLLDTGLKDWKMFFAVANVNAIAVKTT